MLFKMKSVLLGKTFRRCNAVHTFYLNHIVIDSEINLNRNVRNMITGLYSHVFRFVCLHPTLFTTMTAV
jgi:hypothetical protein